jgi:hypothetical protein
MAASVGLRIAWTMSRRMGRTRLILRVVKGALWELEVINIGLEQHTDGDDVAWSQR